MKGYPERDGTADQIVAALSKDYSIEKVIDEYAKKPDKRAYRNDVITARMLIIDVRFADFEKSMFSQQSSLKVGGDTLKSIADLGGSLTGVGQTSQYLSAFSGAIGAAGSSVDSNVYRNKTQDAVLAMMRAERAKVRSRILNRLNLGETGYPLAAALSDLEDYYIAGSVPGALAAITADAGQQKVVADDAINTQLTPSKHLVRNTQLVQSEIYPALDKMTLNQMQGLIANPPTAIPPAAVTILGMRFPTGLTVQNEVDSRAILKFIIDRLAVSQDDTAFESWRSAIENLVPTSP